MFQKAFSHLTIWVIVIALVITAGMIVLTLFAVWYVTPATEAGQVGAPAVTVISAPSQTPTPEPTRTPEDIEETALEVIDGVHVGIAVQIYNTENAGLRLRSEPGIQGAIQFVGDELEIFEVTDGPVTNDGYVWWYLESPYDESRSGWAAANYLRIVE